MFLERESNCCRLRGCLFASMMGLDNLLLKRLSVQPVFIYIFQKSSDGWMELRNEGDALFISILVGITCQGFGSYDV